MDRWEPRTTFSKQEKFILSRMAKKRHLFGFLRNHRHELFDAAFQQELEGMYRATGAGKPPRPPAMMAMAALLQGYCDVSDSDVVELSILDVRWRMVLDWWDEESAPFSQSVFQAFRKRMISTDMDIRLLERTRELARQTKGFDARKLPRTLRVAMDSRPLEGAGRVEDTFNLLGHMALKIVQMLSRAMNRTEEEICHAAGAPLLLASSINAGLDVDWSDDEQKAKAPAEVSHVLFAGNATVTLSSG